MSQPFSQRGKGFVGGAAVITMFAGAAFTLVLIAIALGLCVMAVYQFFRQKRVPLDLRHGLWSLVYIYG